MWVIFVGSAVIVLAAIVVQIFVTRARRRFTHEAERRALEVLDATGLGVAGNVLGSYSLHGRLDGVRVSLDANAWRRPPRAAEDDNRNVTAVRVEGRLQPFTVCRRDLESACIEGDRVPPTTGSSRFDDGYRMTDVPVQTAETGYRDAPRKTGLVSASSADRLVELGLEWAVATEDGAELMFSPTSRVDAGRIARVAANVVLHAETKPELSVEAGPRRPPSGFAIEGTSGPLLGGAILVFFTWWLSALLAMFPPLRSLAGEACCGPDDHIVVTEVDDDDGQSYGLACEKDPTASLLPLYGTSFALVVALALAGPLAFSLARWPTVRGRTDET